MPIPEGAPLQGANQEVQVTVSGTSAVVDFDITAGFTQVGAWIVKSMTGTWTIKNGFNDLVGFAADTTPRNELDIYPSATSSPKQGVFVSTTGSAGWTITFGIMGRR